MESASGSEHGSDHSPKSSSKHVEVRPKDLSEINGRADAEHIRALNAERQKEREQRARALEVR